MFRRKNGSKKDDKTGDGKREPKISGKPVPQKPIASSGTTPSIISSLGNPTTYYPSIATTSTVQSPNLFGSLLSPKDPGYRGSALRPRDSSDKRSQPPTQDIQSCQYRAGSTKPPPPPGSPSYDPQVLKDKASEKRSMWKDRAPKDREAKPDTIADTSKAGEQSKQFATPEITGHDDNAWRIKRKNTGKQKEG